MAVNIDQINIENLSMDELTKLQERIEAAKKVPTGLKAVALASALKNVLLEIKAFDPEILGDALAGSLTPQSMPKEANIGKRYGLSETQISNAKDKGAKLVGAL